MKPGPSREINRKRPVLVTGGCGFIGCNLADRLAARGEHAIVLDSFARKGSEENAQWLKARHHNSIDIVRADTRDIDRLQPAVAEASAVLHLAAQVAVTTSVDDPLDDFSINAAGTLNVLECVRRHNPEAPVIFASTNKVYGKLTSAGEMVRQGERYGPADPRLSLGIAETTPLDFYSPYGCSKGAADQYVGDYARVYGLKTVVLRMSCIYGSRQFGNEDQGWLAHFLIQAIRRNPIAIYGDGCQVRDALHIEDAVAAWLGALERIDQVKGRAFNLGGGPDNTLSLLEALAMIEEITGERPEISFGDWRPGDQPWYVSDIREISAALDWRPRVSLDHGLRSLASWLSSRFGAEQQVFKEALA